MAHLQPHVDKPEKGMSGSLIEPNLRNGSKADIGCPKLHSRLEHPRRCWETDMRRLLLLLSPLFLAVSGVAQAETIAITNVAVVDIANGSTRSRQTVVIRDGTIRAAGDARRTSIPANARRIDGRGRFLMPGLWDMGSFVLNGRTSGVPGAFELMIAHGVVGTRDLGTALPASDVTKLERDIRRGAIVGPRLIWTTKSLSKSLDSAVSGAFPDRAEIRDDAAARAAVAEAARGGAHYIRVVQNLPEQQLPAVIAQARKWHLPVTGAIVSSWSDAAHMGLAGFDHFVDLYRSTARVPERDQFLRLYRDSAFRTATANSRDAMYAFFAPLRSLRDQDYYRSTLATMARLGTPVATNMASMMWARQANAAAIDERRRYAFPEPPQPPPPPTAVDGKSRDGLWSDIRDLRDAGVPLLAGTAAEGSPGDLPGATLLDELEWLVHAGLSPREALAAATVTPAKTIRRLFPRVAAARAIVAGEPADLVLLDANPLIDIAHVRRIHGVMSHGRWFGPAEREALLERAAQLASAPR